MTAANGSPSPPTPDQPQANESIAIQASPPAPPAPAETPAPPPPEPRIKLTPERLARETARIDVILVGLVLLLTFFLGSFAATNSDFWMHLATGRLLARGEYHFGTDPFSYTTEGVRWVNHS